ncbi:hypothetical protein BJ875DRAFT_216445 [Amylocarpus encephaloides]|uniref:Fungal N-terminal domain-containing protein n=1 Tax=Amylocarpus encephaloides TaxID=45428 RepID=A0A9P8C1A5_9HELO|nr:hypothetical protein BJ875DRAFT_216445 [Amylocarpus encephaloides]
MSFGFSVSDFISVATFAWNIYNSCKSSPGEFDNISNEVASLHIVLKNTADHIFQHGVDLSRDAELGRLKTGCRTVLEDIQKLLMRYDNLGAKKRNAWQRTRWALEDISGIRDRLTSNVALLTAFNSNLTNSSQARIEMKLDQLMAINIPDQLDEVTLSPNRASEDINPTKKAQSSPLQGSWEQQQSQFLLPQSLLSMSKFTLDCDLHQGLESGVARTGARPESEQRRKQETRITWATNPSITELITQGGSKFYSDVKGKDVTQGNELEISAFQARRHYIQEGSEFGGSIQAKGSVLQGNKVRI